MGQHMQLAAVPLQPFLFVRGLMISRKLAYAGMPVKKAGYATENR